MRAKQQGREPEGIDAETAALFPDSFEESELGLVPRGWRVVSLGDISKNNSEPFCFSKVDKVVFVNTGDVSNGQFLHKNYSSKGGESLFLRKIFPGILLGKIGKNVRDRLCLRRPRFVLVTSSRPNKGSRHRLQMT